MSSENLLDFRTRIKILKLLALNGELSLSHIIKLTKRNTANVENHLNYLKSHKFIQEKIYARIKI